MFTEGSLQKIEGALGKRHPDDNALLSERLEFICNEILLLQARRVSPDEELIAWFCDWLARDGLSIGYTDETGARAVYKRHPHYSPMFPHHIIDDFLKWYDGYVTERKKRRLILRVFIDEAVRLLRLYSKLSTGIGPPAAGELVRKYDEVFNVHKKSE